ncbi:sensor histidine kinase [Chloroflexota bacterium]
MQTKYERDIYQFLSFYRFFAYALAVVFMQFPVMLHATQMPELQVNILLSVLGVYTLLKVFSPLRWRVKGPLTYLILIGDFLICVVLVIFTGGLSSGFLLYSLTPIMTAALLFEEKTALSLAALASISLSTTHLALSQFSERFAWILEGHQLTLLIIYTIFCFVIASFTYRTNLNIRRRIEGEAIIEERRRIGREIHDGVAQSLNYINLKTRLLRDSISSGTTEGTLIELDDMRSVVKDTYEEIRQSIDQLSTEVVYLPLVPALRGYAKQFSERNNIGVQVNIPRDFAPLSPVAELQLFRIAQEALTNIRRHAMATLVMLNLKNTAQSVEMIIKDNGKGFIATDAEKSPVESHGLDIIRERAQGLGGITTISSALGEGTEVKVSLPIEKVRL